MSLPTRRFYPLDEVAVSWETETKVLLDYAVEGQLEVGARLFGARAEHREGEFRGNEPSRLMDTNVLVGVVALLPADLWHIRCHGIARVRCFASRGTGNSWFQLVTDQPDIEITTAALLVTAEERERFEREHALFGEGGDLEQFIHSPDYRTITLEGRQFMLSSTRARIVAVLHAAWRSGRPWMEKGMLLQAAESDSSRVADVFTDVEERRLILVSDNRGNWRVNLPLPPAQRRAFRRMFRKSHLTLVK